jgi:atypical dual specificity phosphatase
MWGSHKEIVASKQAALLDAEAARRHIWQFKHIDAAMEHTSHMHEFTNEVLRGRLFIGDVIDSDAITDASKYGAVVSLGDSSRHPHVYATAPNVVYHRILIRDEDDAPLYRHFDQAAEFIHHQLEQGRRVLVHCAAGVSRSATICMAYLIRYRDLSMTAAYMVVKDARPIVAPNAGFVSQLLEYEMKQRL